eukprot:TRINITY_DN2530_c0_g2_i1.p1 TRINITY_DN2530_c0_g2~~TRINITY_DN2530_c0_g2_i1.p1  ORF type:complete len:557 (-),score=91.06 TRINITY_DN2530_c0_g2_i1:126-1742(-)
MQELRKEARGTASARSRSTSIGSSPTSSLAGSVARAGGAYLTAEQFAAITSSHDDLRRQNAALLARIEQLELAAKRDQSKESCHHYPKHPTKQSHECMVDEEAEAGSSALDFDTVLNSSSNNVQLGEGSHEAKVDDAVNANSAPFDSDAVFNTYSECGTWGQDVGPEMLPHPVPGKPSHAAMAGNEKEIDSTPPDFDAVFNTTSEYGFWCQNLAADLTPPLQPAEPSCADKSGEAAKTDSTSFDFDAVFNTSSEFASWSQALGADLPPPLYLPTNNEAAVAVTDTAALKLRVPPPPPAAPPVIPSMIEQQLGIDSKLDPPASAPQAKPATEIQPPLASVAVGTMPAFMQLPLPPAVVPIMKPPGAMTTMPHVPAAPFVPPSCFTAGGSTFAFPAPRPQTTPTMLPQGLALPTPFPLPMRALSVSTTDTRPLPSPTPAQSDSRAELGSIGCPTIGSIDHSQGKCRPCAFFHSKGCDSGVDCKFCHLCPPDEKKRRQRSKLEAGKIRSAMWRRAVAEAVAAEAAQQFAALGRDYPAAFLR